MYFTIAKTSASQGEADHKKPGLTLDNPFALLIAASSLENTSLFELPPEYMINTPLPGKHFSSQ